MAEHEPLYETVRRKLEARIADGEWSPGGQLPTERELAAHYRVSRVTVTKAIAKLQSRGLVRSNRGGGTYLTQSATPPAQWIDPALLLNARDVRELMEFRFVLEKEIGRLAVQHASTKDLAALKKLTERMKAHREEPEPFVEADVEFHLVLARASGNRLLASVYELTQHLLRQQMRVGSRRRDAIPRSIDAHERILQGLVQRSEERAVAAITLHLHDSAEEVLGSD